MASRNWQRLKFIPAPNTVVCKTCRTEDLLRESAASTWLLRKSAHAPAVALRSSVIRAPTY